MQRSIRFQYADAYYHVKVRGNRRELKFHDEEDRRFFFKALSEVCEFHPFYPQTIIS
ncbi:hypothetical protein BH11VER1_BH11VER1_38700 [soil metagenome]